jgi:flagellar L-ring protein precursor FlgH
MGANRVCVLSVCGALAGCAYQDHPLVQGPLTARPPSPAVAEAANGSIFQGESYRPLAQDGKPSRIGDTLTITIQEQTTTSATQQVTESRASAINGTLGNGISIRGIPNSLGATGSATQAGKGSNQLATTFASSISVTVMDVLANGNLVVRGEKQVRINGDLESIRLSGVVNPKDVAADRTVSSLKVADARVEQETRGNNSLYNEPGWLTKFFLSVVPF